MFILNWNDNLQSNFFLTNSKILSVFQACHLFAYGTVGIKNNAYWKYITRTTLHCSWWRRLRVIIGHPGHSWNLDMQSFLHLSFIIFGLHYILGRPSPADPWYREENTMQSSILATPTFKLWWIYLIYTTPPFCSRMVQLIMNLQGF